MTANTSIHMWISYFQALLGAILCCCAMSGLNQLDNFINCWFYYMDESNILLTSNSTYQEICEHADVSAEQDVFEPYAFKWSLLTTLMFASAIPGAMLFPVSDKYGRKALIIISCVFHILGTTCWAISFHLNSYLLMAVGSLLVGINGGAAVMIYPVYLVEIAPESKKGMFGASCQLGFNIGTSFSLFVGLEWILGKVDCWSWAIAAQIPLGFLHLVLIYFSVESPAWLKSVGEHGKADEASMKLFGYAQFSHDQQIPPKNSPKKSSDNDTFWSDYVTKTKKIFSDPEIRKPLITCLIFRSLQMTNGVLSFQVFSLTILQNSGVETSVANVTGFVISTISIFASLMALKMMNSQGLRRSYLLSAACAFVSIMTFFTLDFFVADNDVIAYISIGALSMYVIFANLGIMPIPFMLPALWLPDEYKSLITGLMAVVGLMISVPLSFLLPFLLYHIEGYTFLIFATSIGASFVFGYFKMIE